MKRTRLEGLRVWSEFQLDRGIDFSGYLWHAPCGSVLIDPMPLAAEEIQSLQGVDAPVWIIVTNAEHLRAAPQLKQALGAKVIAPAEEKERLGDDADTIDLWFGAGAALPAELAECIEVIELRGGKSPMEPALYLKPLKAIYFGDLVRSHVCGELRLLPDEKMKDPDQVAVSLAALSELSIDAVLLGDGDSIYNGAGDALNLLLR